MSGEDYVQSATLANAIRFRLLVHAALDRDDMPAVCELNRLADAAYLLLSPTDAGRYLTWIRQFVPHPTEIFRGDA